MIDLSELEKTYKAICESEIDLAIMEFSGTEKIQDLWTAVEEILNWKEKSVEFFEKETK